MKKDKKISGATTVVTPLFYVLKHPDAKRKGFIFVIILQRKVKVQFVLLS